MNEKAILDQLKVWHQKLSGFFEQSFVKNQTLMKCSSGCDKCCLVERSVFPIEAELIRRYVATNPIENRAESAVGSCAFLELGRCTVYDVRPSICRTHGLVIQQEDGISHCELNFTSQLPPKSDWMSGKTSDTVLTTLQIAFEKTGAGSSRVELRKLWRELTKEAT